MKRFISFILLIFITLSLVSCTTQRREYYENGYFEYVIVQDNSRLPKKIYISGLTELGLQQKEIIITEYIDDFEVEGLGYYKPINKYSYIEEEVPFDCGENLEKIYFNNADFIMGIDRLLLINCEKINFIFWHYPFSEISLNVNSYIWGYNAYNSFICDETFPYNVGDKIANVSYMYNYEGCPNDGYYWVDSYNEDIITFIPPVPTREGYIFEGWYKEEECINKWDFSSDKTTKEIILTETSQYPEYLGTYLYAKWIEE